MFRKISINSEEFIFYIDLISEFLKKKILAKGINTFIKDKEKFNSLSSYGVVMFQEKGAPITVYDEKNGDIILNIVNDHWENRERKQSFLENGLFEILSYVFRKSQKARKNYRVIIISDTPSSLSEEYHSALYDLIIKARRFDTFIDVIRVGDQKFYDDDVKLKVISSETHSGVFYCNDTKLFPNILSSLVQSKTELTIMQPDEDDQLLEEDKAFYEKLAVDLISLDSEEKELCDICEQELCPICGAYSDEIHKCFNCNAKYHSCCAAEYSLAKNIGFKHLFRCVQCDTLLKLDEDFVMLLYEEKHRETYEEIIEDIETIEKHLEEEYYPEENVETNYYEDTYEQENYIGEEGINPESMDTSSEKFFTKKVRIGGFFGKEVTIKTKAPQNEIGQPMTGTVVSIPEDTIQAQERISITSLKPPKKKTILLCKICGTTLRNTQICPNCGAKVD